MTLAHRFERIVAGGGDGHVTHRIDIGDRAAIACTLGGPADRTLFMLSSTDAYPKRLAGTRLSRVDAVIVDTPAPACPERPTDDRLLLRADRRRRSRGRKVLCHRLSQEHLDGGYPARRPVSALLVRALDDVPPATTPGSAGSPRPVGAGARRRRHVGPLKVERPGKQIELISAETLALGPDGQPRPTAGPPAGGYRNSTPPAWRMRRLRCRVRSARPAAAISPRTSTATTYTAWTGAG